MEQQTSPVKRPSQNAQAPTLTLGLMPTDPSEHGRRQPHKSTGLPTTIVPLDNMAPAQLPKFDGQK